MHPTASRLHPAASPLHPAGSRLHPIRGPGARQRRGRGFYGHLPEQCARTEVTPRSFRKLGCPAAVVRRRLPADSRAGSPEIVMIYQEIPPDTDQDLRDWAAPFSSKLTAAAVSYGVTVQQATELSDLLADYTTKLAAARDSSTRGDFTI